MQTVLNMEEAAGTLKLLGDKTRLSMVALLREHDCCVCEFVEIFQMSQPSISQHLKKLKDIGLVKESRKGQWIMYSLNSEHAHYEMVSSILEHVPKLEEKMLELERKGLRITCN